MRKLRFVLIASLPTAGLLLGAALSGPPTRANLAEEQATPAQPDPSVQMQLAADCGAYAGEIRMWAGPTATIPQGWYVCDGSAVDIAVAPELFAAIGTSWGGDGVPFFRLPDLRGRFARGVDTGSGQDPDRFSRVAWYTGGNTGVAVGTYQLDATARPFNNFVTGSDTHRHQMMGLGHTGNTPGPGNYLQGANNSQAYGSNFTENDTHSHLIVSGGDNETRPTNVYVYYIIFGGCNLVQAVCPGDLSGDRVVDLTDLGLMLGYYGTDCDPNAT